VDATHVRIEADAELTPEEARAVRAALERYAATARGPAPADAGGWTHTARGESIRGRAPAKGGRAAGQAARDRRRRTGERAT
jgi:hypothetical protein